MDMICPLLSVCKAKVTLEHYSTVCSNVTKDAYKECIEYKKMSSESKTPSEWLKLTTPTPP
jgi:hypothetical protein